MTNVKKLSTQLKIPKGYRLATIRDWDNKVIKIDTLYWISSYKEPAKIRRRMQVETELEYHHNYRMVILNYINENKLYILE